jgi:hypothetical protein
MIGTVSDSNPALIGILIALLAFGVIFSTIVSRRPRYEMDAYVSIYVVAGVLVTLIGVAVLNPEAAALVLLCFTFSGTPMVVGSILRHSRLEKNTLDQAKKLVEEHERRLKEKQ